ncbi:flagellar filament core protein FlaB2 [Leptospira broomii serovar Hurstbridge str. 5399]|nr:flagellar filament core protein FlaB2 [Leptospira broomii serovar Hurstbridge str. 5399]
MTKDIEKLSSGMRINRAGDDASGLAVSEKMRTQVGGLRRAEQNTEDGMSLIQTAEGYLQETHEVVQRIRVLAVQAANGIYSEEDRQQIQVEVSQLVDEIDRIASQAEFNKMKLLTGAFARLNPTASMWFHMGANMHQRERIYIETMNTASLGLRNPTVLTFISLSTAGKANSVIGLADDALRLISKQRADLGAYYNRLEHAAKGLMNAYENIQAAESRIRDTDMAEQMTSFTRYQILTQAATAMLAQANMKPQTVLQLLK